MPRQSEFKFKYRGFDCLAYWSGARGSRYKAYAELDYVPTVISFGDTKEDVVAALKRKIDQALNKMELVR